MSYGRRTVQIISAITVQKTLVMRTMVFGDYFIEEGEFGLESEGKMELTQVERSDSNPGR